MWNAFNLRRRKSEDTIYRLYYTFGVVCPFFVGFTFLAFLLLSLTTTLLTKQSFFFVVVLVGVCVCVFAG